MSQKPTLSIGGPPGSGTTTVSKILENTLGLKHIYVGALFRKMAEEMGMDLESFGRYAEHHPEIDIELDRRAVEMARAGGVILEGRLAGWMLYKSGVRSYRVWIDADPEERARRVAHRDGGTLGENTARMIERERGERERYINIYQVDLEDMSIYHLVLDSTRTPARDVAASISEGYLAWCSECESGGNDVG